MTPDGHSIDETGPSLGAPLNDGPLYVFGYGSLMWMPGFEPVSTTPARVLGWHRRFSRVSTTSWGNPQAPGLCAALHPGGTTWGRIIEIPQGAAEPIMAGLNRREAAYRRRLVTVDARFARGTRRLVVHSYVADPADPTLAPDLAPETARVYARSGTGTKGSAFDYIANTVAALAEDGHRWSDAHRFFAMISR